MDLWSLGVIVYSLATKQFPFSPCDLKLFCRNDGEFPFPRSPMLQRWSEDGLAFVEALLRPLPRDRLSAVDALRHPWITSMSEEIVDPLLSLTKLTSVLSNKSVDVSDSDSVDGHQKEGFENTANPSLMAPAETQSPASILSTLTWPGPSQTIPQIQYEMPSWLTSPLEHVGASYPQAVFQPSLDRTTALYHGTSYGLASLWPRPPSREITAPNSYLAQIPPPTSYGFAPPPLATDTTRCKRAPEKLERRATAPTPMLLVEDAVDRISPRSQHNEVSRSFWNERHPKSRLPNSTSSTRDMPVTESSDPAPSRPPRQNSLVRSDTRLERYRRSQSDSSMQLFSRRDHADRGWKRRSALRYIDDLRSFDSVYALRQAIQDGRGDVVDLLIDQGFETETVFRDPPHLQLGTALHLAIRYGQIAVVEILLKRGASVRAKARAELSNFDMKWLEPLHLAAYYGLDEIARMLLAYGARIGANAIGNFTKREKRTPLHLAVLGDDSEEVPRMVRLLLDCGADPNVKDDIGMRPGDYAVMLGLKGLKKDLPSSSAPKLRAMVGKMRVKLGPFALAGPLILGAAGVAMVMT